MVDDGSEGHEERAMAISLEELQKQAKAAKLLKNNDSEGVALTFMACHAPVGFR